MQPEQLRAVFRVFTPEQRLAFWQDKLNQVINLGGWNSNEAAFLNSVKSELKLAWFTDDFKKDSVNVKSLKAVINKLKDGSNALGWSKKLMYGIFGSGYNLSDKNGTLTTPISSGTDQSTLAVSSTKKLATAASEATCSCATSDDWCATQSGHDDSCKTGKCTTSSFGCGWLFTTSCNGLCSYL